MTSIQNEIDSFQSCCEEILKTTSQPSAVEEQVLEELRGDRFLQTTMKLQSELIGRALLEIDESDNTGFHSHITTLREQFAEEVKSHRNKSKKRGWIHHQPSEFNSEEVKKKYLSKVVQHAQEELQTEYKRCVQDIVDFAANSSKLFYREMALRYWLLLSHYKEHGKEDTIYEVLTAANQEILERFTIANEKRQVTSLSIQHPVPTNDAASEQQ